MHKLRESPLGQLQRLPGHQRSSPSNCKLYPSSTPNANQNAPISPIQLPKSILPPSPLPSGPLPPSLLSPSTLHTAPVSPPSTTRTSTTHSPRPTSHLRCHGQLPPTSHEHPPPSSADKNSSKRPPSCNSISQQRHTTSKVSKRPQPKQRNTTSKAPFSTSNTVFSKPKQRNSTSKAKSCPRQIKQNTAAHTQNHTLNPQEQIPHCSKVQQNSLPRDNQQHPTTSTQSSHQTTIPSNQLISNTPSNTSKRIRQPQVSTRTTNKGTNGDEPPGVHQLNTSNFQRNTGTNSELKILHWNCEGANEKINTILDSIKNDDIDIALLQDTRIKEHPDNKDIFKLDGYATYSTPHELHGKKGLATIIKNSIRSDEHVNPDIGNHTHVLSIKITFNAQTFLVHNIYRTESLVPYPDFSPLFTDIPGILGGDFNAHHWSWGSSNNSPMGSALYNQITESNYLLVKPLSPTRKKSFIDLSIVHSSLWLSTKWEINDSFSSDHRAVQLTITLPKNDVGITTSFSPKWILKKADWEQYKLTITSISNSTPISTDINTESTNINEIITAAANKHIPKTKPTTNRKDNWYDSPLTKHLRSAVNHANKQFRKGNLNFTHDDVQELRQQYKEACDSARHNSWREWIEETNMTTSMSKIWGHLNRCRGTPRRTPLTINPLDKATALCQDFSNRTKSNNLAASTIQKLEELNPERNINILRAIAQNTDSDSPLTINELNSAIKSRKKDSAPGADAIVYSLIKQLPDVFKSRILNLFNLIFNSSKLPADWKTARLCAIPKPNKPDQFRPISLLPCLAKIQEIIMLRRLRHVAQPLNKSAFGFKKQSGTDDALANILSDIGPGSKPAVIVFLDLEKAFELANPSAILNSLANRNVKGKLLSWIKEFLTERKANLKYQGAISETMPFENGTPQGSIISPTLFNYLIEEILELELPRNVKIQAYADDIVIYQKINKPKNVRPLTIRPLQLALDSLTNCINKLGLKISIDKTKALCTKLNTDNLGMLTLNNVPLQWASEYKYLGVHIDDKLNFKAHVSHLENKALKRINCMKVLSSLSGVNAHILRLFYIQAIAPVLEYGSIASTLATKTQIDRLQRIQNIAMRLILGAPKHTRIQSMSNELYMPDIRTKMNTRTANIIHKIACNGEHPLHANVSTALLQDPELFKSTTLTLVTSYRKFRPPLYDPDRNARLMLAPWLPHSFSTTVYKPFHSKHSLSPEILLEIYNTQLENFDSPNNSIFYTDGSKTDSGVAAACFSVNTSKAITLNPDATVMQAELTAIKLALKSADKTKQLIIHTDSLTSIQALENKDSQNNTSLLNTITDCCSEFNQPPIINWIPSHIGLTGNEAVDKLANSATENRLIDEVAHPSREYAKKRISRAAIKDWEDTLKKNLKGSSVLHSKLKNSPKERKMLLNLTPRSIQRQIFKIRLGVKSLPLVTDKISNCIYCDHQFNLPQSEAIHFVTDCPVLFNARQKLLDYIKIEERALAPNELFTAIINAQTDRQYKELIQLLNKFPYPF